MTMTCRSRPRGRAGFTRGELVVVVLLVLAVLGIAVSYLFRNRGRAAQAACAENLRRIGLAIYGQQGIKIKGDVSPEGLLGETHVPLPPARISEGYATWAVPLGMFLAPDSGLKRWDLALPFIQQTEEARNALVPLFFCPARNRSTRLWSREEEAGAMSGTLGDYACASGDGNSLFPWMGPRANGAIIEGEVLEWGKEGRIEKWRSRTSTEDLLFEKKGRGLAYTILIGEKHVPLSQLGQLEVGDGSLYDGRTPVNYARIGGPGFGLASGPDAPFNFNFGSAHPGYTLFLYADVSVRQAAVNLNEEVLGELIKR